MFSSRKLPSQNSIHKNLTNQVFLHGVKQIRRMGVTLLLILTLSFFHNCAAKHEKLTSAMVVGTVYCDTCFHQKFSKTSHFISGASVEVECRDLKQKTGFHEEVRTNKYGEFEVQLPFTVSKHIKKIKKCLVKLVSSSEPFCSVSSMATSSVLHLKSRRQGIHVFSAGFFTFKPLKQPELCYEKPSPETNSLSSMKTLLPYPDIPPFPPLNQNPPPMLNLPSIPQLPQLPPLPTLPTLPPIPNMGLLPKQPGQTTPADFSNRLQSSKQGPDQPTFTSPTPPVFGTPFSPNNQLKPPPLVPTEPLQQPSPFINPPTPVITPPLQPVLPVPFPPFSFPPQPPALPGISPISMSKKTFP